MKLTGSDILALQHISAEDLAGPPRVFSGVSIDSRSVQAGSIFFAIRGERLDGHSFLSTAVKSGAKALVVERKWAAMNPSFLKTLQVSKLVVENTTLALGELARNYRRTFRIPVIALGGSNGKTTTKDMIKAVLQAKFPVLATEGNLNNHIGVPLTLFRLEEGQKAAVVEVGTNHPGEIDYLCSILEPTHGLITNIGREHLEFFRTMEGVAEAELELFDWLRAHRGDEGTLFLNKDDDLLSRRGRGPCQVVSYGFSRKEMDLRGSRPELNEYGAAQFTVQTPKKQVLEISLAVPGLHNASNALAAAAVGFTFNVPPAKIAHALGGFSAARNRMESMRVNGITILNDTYNSNPDSVRAALETLGAMKTAGKKIAVLSDMLELGDVSEKEHRSVASLLPPAGVEYLLTYGPLSRHTHDASKLPFKAHYDQKNVLSEYLAELLTSGDIVLVKGSRGMKMEDVVTFLKERFSKAA